MRTNWHAAALPRFVLVASITLLAPAWKTQSAPAADVIFTGQFITLDPSRPRVEALAVARGRIVGAGSRSEIDRLGTGSTRRIEFAGVALPGLSDAHVHVGGLGQQLERLDLRGLSKPKILEKVAEAVRSAPKGSWVFGQGWDEGFWRPAAFPAAAELDAVSADHPVVLRRIDGHSMWVNSAVLSLAGISRSTPDPPGGRVYRNTENDPTGMLVDRAMDAVGRVTPEPTPSERERRIRAALRQYARWGLTSVHDAGADLESIAIYKDLLARGELPVRIYTMAQGTGATLERCLAQGPEVGLGEGRLSIRSFKIFLDGALGSRGAELADAYSDAPGERGLRLMDDGQLDEFVRAARGKGFQVAAHAIGDLAVRRALDGYERGGATARDRFRIEHASVIPPDALPRFTSLGVIASIQPVFVGEYSRWADDRLGALRVGWVLPMRQLLAAGANVASGTDYPASDSGDPIATLYCTVTRKNAEGSRAAGWRNEQSTTVDAALRSMTLGPAFAAFQENDLGQITVGRFADFTVVSADPYELPAEALRTLTVRMTVVAGSVTFDSRHQADLGARY